MRSASDRTAGIRASAETVLRRNDEGRYTVPSRTTYPHQWNWDSALIALGWAELDPNRAWSELESLLAARNSEGLVPHIAFRARPFERIDPGGRLLGWIARPGARYLPGPRWWGELHGRDGRRISAITQPPLAATCMRLLFERWPDERRARPLLAPLAAWHRFLLRERDPDGAGEPVLIHPWESGRDNAVEWDVPLWRVIPTVTVVHRRDTASVHPSERPSDEHYRRYLSLVRHGRRDGWRQERLAASGPFRVLDPGFSGILARAAGDLGWLAEQLGEEELAGESRAACERVSGALRARAGADDGLIRPLDLVSGATLRATSAGSALAVLSPGLDGRTAKAVRDLVRDGSLSSPFGVRSLEAGHPRLEPRNYWRGPVWANVTWLCAEALAGYGEEEVAAELHARMMRAIAAGGMREYFTADEGLGLGTRDFAWTAALALW